MTLEKQYKFHLYSNNKLKESSGWFSDLYSSELNVYSYLSCNPMTEKDTLYIVSNLEKDNRGIYIEDKYEVVKIIYGSLCKNSANCYQIPSENKDLVSRFENTMVFSEDELIYKKALWISQNRHLFKSFDKSKLDNFVYNEYICNYFHLKTLLYLGLDPENIPWEHIESHPDLRDYVREIVEYDEIWLSKYRENMLDLVKLAKDLKMLDCKFNNVMRYFGISDIFS